MSEAGSGRWGKDDERGMLNLVTDAKVVEASHLVAKGKIYSLGLPLDETYNVPTHPGRGTARLVSRVFQYPGDTKSADDFLFVNTHARTHIDGLAHVMKGNTMYNGFDAASVLFNSHAEKCGIEKIGAIVNRGVLLDIPALRGVESLERGTVITAKDLEECAMSQGIRFNGGETLLVRTGWLRRYEKDKPLEFHREAPGVNLSVVDFIDKNQIAVVGSDTSAFEVYPPRDPSYTPIPVHIELIWRRGIHIIEQMNLEKVAADKVWDFLFVLIPLPVVGALGSPVNPVAIC